MVKTEFSWILDFDKKRKKKKKAIFKSWLSYSTSQENWIKNLCRNITIDKIKHENEWLVGLIRIQTPCVSSYIG